MNSRRRRRPWLSIFTLALSFNINVHPSAVQIHPFTIHTHVSANSRYRYSLFLPHLCKNGG
jgi:hypothetical protein